MFQFINSYASLFYIAFAKEGIEGCDNGDCLGELGIQLGTIYITNLFLNLLELGLPYAMGKFKLYRERRKLISEGREIRMSVE